MKWGWERTDLGARSEPAANARSDVERRSSQEPV